MYAVIKTGGKQYRVQAGDLLVVEKLDGEPGAEVAFGDVLMVGDGEAVTIGAPLVDGAKVSATLIETRKGEKVKIFKKIRRQGYRRTRGHRQSETVLRVTAIDGAGKSAKWDGKVNEIRAMKDEDVAKAEVIANWLRSVGFEIEVVNLTNRWDGAKKVRPNTFEIWFGDKDLPPICTGKQTLASPPPSN